MLFGRVLRVTGVSNDRWRQALADLRAVVVRRGVVGPDVDDVVQAAVEKALRRFAGLRDESRFEPWLKSIAANTARDALRASSRRADHLDLTAAEQVRVAVEEPEPLLSFADCVDPFIDRLPASDRDVLRLREIDRRSVGQTAEALGISVSAAKSRVLRARRRLARDLTACCAALGHSEDLEETSVGRQGRCCPNTEVRRV